MGSTQKNQNQTGVGRSLEILARELRQEAALSAERSAAEKAAFCAATRARSAQVLARLTAGLTLEEALR